MHLFYAPGLTDQPEFTLSPEESHHAVRVLRLVQGDPVVLVNGCGGWYSAVIAYPDPRNCPVEITESKQGIGKPGYELHVAMAPTRQIDRFEWFIEKATEIGITSITPIICSRSERKEVKTDRLIKVAIAAMKQSLTAYHPAIHSLSSFKQFVSRPAAGSKWIAHCNPGNKNWLDESLQKDQPWTILIGPEGDFTPAEVELAGEAGYLPLTLGTSRLRTETAGLVAVQTVNWLYR